MSVLLLDAAKTHLNITAATSDAEIQAVIDAAEAALTRLVGPLEPTAVTDRVGGCSDSLAVKTVPAISITSITGISGSVLDLTGMHLEPRSGVITHNLGRYFVEHAYDVAYSAGRTTCPADLLMADKELVRHIWQTQRGGTGRPGSRTLEMLADTLPGSAYTFPFRVNQLIAPHLQPGFA